VLYDLYFLPPQFYFLPNLIHVVYEKTKIVPSSKTNVQPCHPTGVGVHARHLSPWYTLVLTWLSFFFMIILMISYIYIKSGVAETTPIWLGGGPNFFFFFFHFSPWWWLGHPHGPQGWFGHPQTGQPPL
jgi:hypothetical protein